MKKALLPVLLVLLLCGCGKSNDGIERAMSLRERLLNANGCSFLARITADYGDEIYTFTLSCEADQDGSIRFCVKEPESIAGVEGKIDSQGGKLTYEDKVLGFSMLADQQITPVSAPWILLKTLRSGYIHSCERVEDRYKLQINDSYYDNAMHLDIVLNSENIPVAAEILWQGRRIVSLDVEDFVIL